jgi:predicted nucleic acid-binding protein
MIQLDTSFLIHALVPASSADAQLREWLAQQRPLGVSAVAWTEFLCGPVGPNEVALAQTLLGEPVPFTAEDSAQAARLFNLGGRRRGSLVDCMIAAAAMNRDAPLATANRGDFERLTAFGLTLA